MNIQEAVAEAVKEEKYIERKKFVNESAYYRLKIKPTNSSATCIAYSFNREGEEVHHCKNWNPTADDLMANDWKLSDKQQIKGVRIEVHSSDSSNSTKEDPMEKAATYRQLAEWSRMSLTGTSRIRKKANISMCISGINLLTIIIFIIAYFIK